MASTSQSKKEEQLSDQEVIERYNELRQEYSTVAQKISEIEMDRSEHKLVLDALQSLEPERKCYRLVGGVLVERTAAEVRPAVGSNVEGMEELLKQLNKALQEKEKAVADHVAKYKLKVRGQEIKNEKADANKPQQAGVLA
jgi:prefoldin subunit 2|mmetsp:Transcript_81389/g.136222  ORF Transcript_81389/g.136222 Transcript_81389/m.136222 type:complete len:141 (-) Transcript_81389:997-1419(-)|eukprot:CAMPEP_0174285100 /NCGR_PEP_ID=MMETSP0809-20121228/7607_1 /TAXON_ID=73025 ORGANISM="Eutreptiella gymnastica-like, Strain CCMP1594" /NCGR_SAMPLE_ID=MMETSP0809 /ASSEMBLY_ACC=CAM_ASM_000658 /LENGTH=140 /DNA_ID=CAMNT_0015380791 /DNA_START=48 /DNA_END=470 /DNA_ORIENTATION=+